MSERKQQKTTFHALPNGHAKRTEITFPVTALRSNGQEFLFNAEIALIEKMTPNTTTPYARSISISTPIDENFLQEIDSTLSDIPSEKRATVLHFFLQTIHDFQPKLIISQVLQPQKNSENDSDNASLIIKHTNTEKGVAVVTLTPEKVYIHRSYAHPSHFVSFSGGVPIGNNPYYISALANNYPHHITVSTAEVTSDFFGDSDIPTIELFFGMRIHRPFREILHDFFTPAILKSLRTTNLDIHSIPTTLESFITVNRL